MHASIVNDKENVEENTTDGAIRDDHRNNTEEDLMDRVGDDLKRDSVTNEGEKLTLGDGHPGLSKVQNYGNFKATTISTE
jgi:hypothetical protein